MSDLPKNSASNIDEFNAQARSFAAKAKAAGKSNTAIANTVKLMYQMYSDDQASKITPYQQATLDMANQPKWTPYQDSAGNVYWIDQFGNKKPFDGNLDEVANKNKPGEGSSVSAKNPISAIPGGSIMSPEAQASGKEFINGIKDARPKGKELQVQPWQEEIGMDGLSPQEQFPAFSGNITFPNKYDPKKAGALGVVIPQIKI